MKYYGFVYITENLLNGKKYIGQRTYNSPRWEDYLGSGRLLLKAIQRYGKENFRRTILFEAETKEALDEAEKRIIAEMNAVEDDTFYNLAPGGHGCSLGFKGKKHSPETREKMRQAALGHSVPQKTRDAVSKARKGHVKGADTIRKHKEKVCGANHFRAIRIVIDGVEYPTITAARQATGLSFYKVKRLAQHNEKSESSRHD